jgi:glycosyltransferase involved in cell wall biosynthesis
MDRYAPAARPPLRILVLTRSYPAAGDLYQYPFVHRRVLAYLAAGHEVAVYRPTRGDAATHEFEGVTCYSGDASAFRAFAKDWVPDVVAAHGFSEAMWRHLEKLDRIPVRAWLHGSEIPAFFRRKAECIPDSGERASALKAVEARRAFWEALLKSMPSALKLIFPSRSAVQLARQDWDGALSESDYAIVPNPIDTELFTYRQKLPEDRWRVLMIRPFDSRTYGNDLAVSAICHLSERSGFGRLRFTIFGDGPLFDETVAPLRAFQNVTIERRFLAQSDIARQHRRHGIFLVPTRLDTQGVSRDEAMASGLVPVTNAVSAVPEFVDESCAALAGADDPVGLADVLSAMLDDPGLFLRRSAAAAERVKRQSGHEAVIPKEIALLSDASRCIRTC